MPDQAPNRRERLRAETTAEIKTTALALMASGGPDAITLRAIARRMGMTANAIYGYFPTRDELVTTLINEVYTSLMNAVEKARDTCGEDDAAGRILAWAEAFRTWSVANPEGFRLIYGDPVPGYEPPPAGAAPQAAHRACLGLVGLAAGAWPLVAARTPGRYDWSDFDPRLTEKVRAAFPDLPPAAVALALRLWGRLHGLVTLEIYGHLRHQILNPAKLYRDEVSQLLASLGFSGATDSPATGKSSPA